MPGLRVRVGAWYPTTTALARAATCAGFPGTASAAGLSPTTLAGPPESATPAATVLAPSVRPASHLRTRIVINLPPPLLLSAVDYETLRQLRSLPTIRRTTTNN